MERSSDCGDLFAALAVAQGAAQDALIDKVNPAFKSRYASLSAVLERCRPVLSANGLALTMAPIREEGLAGVEWLLGHKSGQWMSGTVLYRIAQDTPQGAGSATTYARRYAYSSLLGIAADEDDDGNAGSATAPQARNAPNNATEARPAPKRDPEPAKRQEPRTEVKQEPTPATIDQKRALFAAMTKRGLDTEDKEARRMLCDQVLGIGACETFKTLTTAQASALLDAVGDGPDAWADIRLQQIWSRAANTRAAAGPPSLLDDTQPGTPDPFGDDPTL